MAKFPTPAQFPNWKRQLYTDAVSVSGLSDFTALRVLQTLDLPSASQDSLADAGDLFTLWQKLATGLRKCLADEHDKLRQIALMERQQLLLGRCLNGLQILLFIFGFFTPCKVNISSWSLEDLMTLACPSFKNVEAFLIKWDGMLASAQESETPLINDALITFLFTKQFLQGGSHIQADIDYQDRTELDSPEHQPLDAWEGKLLHRTEAAQICAAIHS